MVDVSISKKLPQQERCILTTGRGTANRGSFYRTNLLRGLKGDTNAANALKRAVVAGFIANKIEVACKARVFKRRESITAHRGHLAGQKFHVKCKLPFMLMLGNGSLVNHSLTVVLFGGFKLVRRQLRETIGDTVKPDVANLFLNAAVLDGNDGVLNNQGLAEATLDCDTLEVSPVESATEAFSPENRILAESLMMLKNNNNHSNKIERSNNIGVATVTSK